MPVDGPGQTLGLALPPPQPPEAGRGRQVLHRPGQDKGDFKFIAFT